MSQAPFPAPVISEAVYWGRLLGEEWARDFAEAPVRIHQSSLAPDGTREWERAFTNWIEGRNEDEARQRTTKVMRKLRRVSPRAYEVLYRAMVQGESFDAITTWLNERAIRNNIPLPDGKSVHYTLKDAVAVFIAGVSYARFYW
jgi:hypothetical protein